MNENINLQSLFPKSKELEFNLSEFQNIELGEQEAGLFWSRCLEIIKDNVNSQVFKTWFKPIKALKWSNNKLFVKIPSQFFCEWIEGHYYQLMQTSIHKVLGNNAALQYEIVLDENNELSDNKTIKFPAFKYPPTPIKPLENKNKETHTVQDFPTCLNPRYSLSNYIQGESNQLAVSAATAVSKNPGGTRFNPLFIYGDTGLGKTHLLQAIGNFILQINGRMRVLYTTSEHFTMEFINSIQNNKANEFIAFYRSIDVLLIDDIQFLAGKEKTQDNFFHTFNALHQSGKQLVLTSDKPPKDLSDVDDRLISRFQWGLTVDIQPPDLETRMAIIQKKSSDEGIELPIDIVEYLARNITHNVREMEGTLISLIAKHTFDNRELDLQLAKEIINGKLGIEDKAITVDFIKEIVCNYYNIPTDLLVSKSRKHEITLARQMAIYLAKQYTLLSLKSIGSNFGGRDHSTILHSCQAIENYLVTDKLVKQSYHNLLKTLNINDR